VEKILREMIALLREAGFQTSETLNNFLCENVLQTQEESGD